MYLSGFGNHHQTEAILGALPLNQNSPQHCSFGLYAEQYNASAFTKARSHNLKSWLYRKHPSVHPREYELSPNQMISRALNPLPPNPFRWSAIYSQHSTDWLNSLYHIAFNSILNVLTYDCTQSMDNRFFCSRDGELLFVPYSGKITLITEYGLIELLPGEIAIIPRGVLFSVMVDEAPARGYLCENSGHPLGLPELGPIGANGLAHPRHFLYPKAYFEEKNDTVTLYCKFQNTLWETKQPHSPINVVAWHGNYAPYKYKLSLFNTINTVSFDHPDPSIFTVLTSPSAYPGEANLDFVIFPPRWMVAEHTFRPPYFHRNYMNELMGLIYGQYDAKAEGFVPGGMSIHNCMTPHGPDYSSYMKGVDNKLQPQYADSLAFMFETNMPWQVTEQAYHHSQRQKDYPRCWLGF